MSLTIRLFLWFIENRFHFAGFFPESKEDALLIPLPGGKFIAGVYVSYRVVQVLDPLIPPHLEDLIKEAAEDTKYEVGGLTLFLVVEGAGDTLLSALREDRQTKETDSFALDVYEAAIHVYNSLVDFFRTSANQYWLKTMDYEPDRAKQFLRDECRTVWEYAEDKGHPFPPGTKGEARDIYTSASGYSGITRDLWRQAGAFIQSGKRIPTRRILLANSIQHLHQQGGRLAVVEAVTALESGVRQLLARAVVRLPGTPRISEKSLNSLIEKAGLRLTMTLMSEVLQHSMGLTKESLDLVYKAIDLRNNIIHNDKRSVRLSDAEQYVEAIRGVLDVLDQWAANSPP